MNARCPHCGTIVRSPLTVDIQVQPLKQRARSVRRTWGRYRCRRCRRPFKVLLREERLVLLSERRWRAFLKAEREGPRLRGLSATLARVQAERTALESQLQELRAKVGVAVLVEKALAAIDIQTERLAAADARFREQDRVLFERAVVALQERDMQTASVASTELAELRRTTRAVATAQSLVLTAAQRLRAAREVAEAESALAAALTDLETARLTLSQLLPDLAHGVVELAGTVRATVSQLKAIAMQGALPVPAASTRASGRV